MITYWGDFHVLEKIEFPASFLTSCESRDRNRDTE